MKLVSNGAARVRSPADILATMLPIFDHGGGRGGGNDTPETSAYRICALAGYAHHFTASYHSRSSEFVAKERH